MQLVVRDEYSLSYNHIIPDWSNDSTAMVRWSFGKDKGIINIVAQIEKNELFPRELINRLTFYKPDGTINYPLSFRKTPHDYFYFLHVLTWEFFRGLFSCSIVPAFSAPSNWPFLILMVRVSFSFIIQFVKYATILSRKSFRSFVFLILGINRQSTHIFRNPEWNI